MEPVVKLQVVGMIQYTEWLILTDHVAYSLHLSPVWCRWADIRDKSVAASAMGQGEGLSSWAAEVAETGGDPPEKSGEYSHGTARLVSTARFLS